MPCHATGVRAGASSRSEGYGWNILDVDIDWLHRFDVIRGARRARSDGVGRILPDPEGPPVRPEAELRLRAALGAHRPLHRQLRIRQGDVLW